MSDFDSVELRRMRWRSRRGLLELDLILDKFLAGPFKTLTPAQLDAYRRVLRLEDNDFLDAINDKMELENPSEMEIIAMLRSI